MGKTLRSPIRRRHALPAQRSQRTPGTPSPSDGVEAYLLPNGETARRYWAIPGRILVGGRILSVQDAENLRSKYGVTHNLSAESEQNDEATWLDASTRARFPFPDDEQPIPADLCRGIIAYQRAVLSIPTAALYCHCRLAGSRGPSLAYAALRVLGQSQSEALAQCGRRRIYSSDIHATYVESIERALKALPSA
jgi:hypothetical protein